MSRRLEVCSLRMCSGPGIPRVTCSPRPLGLSLCRGLPAVLPGPAGAGRAWSALPTPLHLGSLLDLSSQGPPPPALPPCPPPHLSHFATCFLPTCSLAAFMKEAKISDLPTGPSTDVWFQTSPHRKASLQTAPSLCPVTSDTAALPHFGCPSTRLSPRTSPVSALNSCFLEKPEAIWHAVPISHLPLPPLLGERSLLLTKAIPHIHVQGSHPLLPRQGAGAVSYPFPFPNPSPELLLL